MKKLLVLSIVVLLLTACSATDLYELKTGKIKCSDLETIKKMDGYMIIDVRTPEEYEEGHLEEAINIEYQNIVEELNEQNISKDTPIVVYCKSGGRSGQAFESLEKEGFTSLYDLGAMSNCTK